MRIIEKQEVSELLPMDECIRLMRDTLMEYSHKEARQVLRTAMAIGPQKILGVMPAAITSRHIAGAKILTVFPGNFKKDLPSHQGVVVIFETNTGAIRAVVDGEAITGIRTAAISAVATDTLARSDAHVLTMLGSGSQARRHLDAIHRVRDITEVRVWDIDTASAACYIEEMTETFGIPIKNCCGNVQQAVENADIICTVTSSRQPILFGAHVAPGTHINAVGACAAADRELDTEIVRRARFFGDSSESVHREAGDYLLPLQEGAIDERHFLGEIGSVIAGDIPGRKHPDEITIFEALGLAVEDLAAADYVIAKQKGNKQDD